MEINSCCDLRRVRFTQHVDHSLVVSSKQPYGVFKQQHECCVDHSVGQLVRVGLEEMKTEGE